MNDPQERSQRVKTWGRRFLTLYRSAALLLLNTVILFLLNVQRGRVPDVATGIWIDGLHVTPAGNERIAAELLDVLAAAP